MAYESDGSTSEGKYFAIDVPGWNPGAANMRSYLRLGVRDLEVVEAATPAPSTGEDLARKAGIDGLDVGGADEGIWGATIAPEAVIFEDDDRKREGAPHYTPDAARVAETDKIGIREIMTAGMGTSAIKGGWRDHSDGNRITTTRGDKIEVIGGNYKLVILGRQDDAADSVNWDISGGHIRDSTINMGTSWSTEVKWVQKTNGRWQVTEKVDHGGDTFSRYLGDKHEYFCGDIKYEETGSAAPTAAQPNPVITEKTWATSVSEYKGSSSLPVPTISEETWAGAISEKTTAATINELTEAGAIAETTLAGAIAETTIAVTTLEVTIAPIQLEIAVGAKIELFAGAKVELELSAALEMTLGTSTSLYFGAKTDLYNGKDEIKLMKNEIKEMDTKLHAAKQKVHGLKNSVSQVKTRVATLHNRIAASQTRVDEDTNILGCFILMN